MKLPPTGTKGSGVRAGSVRRVPWYVESMARGPATSGAAVWSLSRQDLAVAVDLADVVEVRIVLHGSPVLEAVLRRRLEPDAGRVDLALLGEDGRLLVGGVGVLRFQ